MDLLLFDQRRSAGQQRAQEQPAGGQEQRAGAMQRDRETKTRKKEEAIAVIATAVVVIAVGVIITAACVCVCLQARKPVRQFVKRTAAKASPDHQVSSSHRP
jgi:hypothetical protein